MKKEKIKIRKCKLSDDFYQVGRLLYLTDIYIYPYLSNNNEVLGSKLMAEYAKANTVFNYKNIKVAVLDSKIVGLVLGIKRPSKNHSETIFNIAKKFKEIDIENVKTINDQYFESLSDQHEGVYIVNLCVDPKHRNLGIGTKLMTSYKEKIITLEALKENTNALKLYKKLGFKKINEACAFGGMVVNLKLEK